MTSDDGPRSQCCPGTLKDTRVLGSVEGLAAKSVHPVPVSVAFMAAACSLVTYVFASLTSRKWRTCRKKAQAESEAPGSGLSSREIGESRRSDRSCVGRANRFILITYVLLRFIYTVLFAFSAFYVLLTVCLERHLEGLERSLQHNSTLTEMLYQRLAFEATEQLRHSFSRRFCEPIEAVTVFLEPRSPVVEVPRSGVSTAWNKNLADYGEELRRFLGEFRRVVEGRLDRVMRNFSRVLRSSMTNSWLVFPQSLFNVTLVAESVVDVLPGVAEPGGKWEVDFALFLGIAEPEGVEARRRELWNRLEARGFQSTLICCVIAVKNELSLEF